MADEDGIWRYHVMACPGGWKIVHVRKGTALSAADRAATAKNRLGLRAGVVNHQDDGSVREHLKGGPRKPGSGFRRFEPFASASDAQSDEQV